MPTILGGLRARLIIDSLRVEIIDGLSELGWFDPNRGHRPVDYTGQPNEWDEAVAINSFAITAEDTDSYDFAFGGEYGDTTTVYVDIYAESDIVGRHLAYDIRDLVTGRFPEGPGPSGPVLDVYDFRLATPSVFTVVDVEDVRVDKALGFPRAWQRYWWVLRIHLVDEFYDEQGVEIPAPVWTDELQLAWLKVRELAND